MRVIVTGGGTGGHINPALAIAGTVRAKEPDAAILYVGNKGGMEERVTLICWGMVRLLYSALGGWGCRAAKKFS